MLKAEQEQNGVLFWAFQVMKKNKKQNNFKIMYFISSSLPESPNSKTVINEQNKIFIKFSPSNNDSKTWEIWDRE